MTLKGVPKNTILEFLKNRSIGPDWTTGPKWSLVVPEEFQKGNFLGNPVNAHNDGDDDDDDDYSDDDENPTFPPNWLQKLTRLLKHFRHSSLLNQSKETNQRRPRDGLCKSLIVSRLRLPS